MNDMNEAFYYIGQHLYFFDFDLSFWIWFFFQSWVLSTKPGPYRALNPKSLVSCTQDSEYIYGGGSQPYPSYSDSKQDDNR